MTTLFSILFVLYCVATACLSLFGYGLAGMCEMDCKDRPINAAEIAFLVVTLVNLAMILLTFSNSTRGPTVMKILAGLYFACAAAAFVWAVVLFPSMPSGVGIIMLALISLKALCAYGAADLIARQRARLAKEPDMSLKTTTGRSRIRRARWKAAPNQSMKSP